MKWTVDDKNPMGMEVDRWRLKDEQINYIMSERWIAEGLKTESGD